MARFYIENFGCRATQADGAALERQFLERGLERAQAARDAEIVVLNTCTVTEGADKDARASIRKLQRVNPDCQILVTGCYAQRAPGELAALPGVTWVVGNSHKHQVAEIATASSHFHSPASNFPSSLGGSTGFVSVGALAGENREKVVVGDIFAHTELMAAPVFEAANERTRPNLKVQDGCDNRCSFCVIPYVRGQSRSLAAERAIAEVRNLVDAGYREVVISGINLGRWGRDLESSGRPSLDRHQVSVDGRLSIVVDEHDDVDTMVPSAQHSGQDCERLTTRDHRLEGLIRAILEETPLEKLRISSVEPMDWSDELIHLVASSPRIAKHAHVPMQSGSDTVLRRMHRKYRPWHYREKVVKIRKAMPQAAIGADVMVGFPGETDAEFAETRRMIEELPFTYLHVFTYSARPGTPAAEHADQVPSELARKRNSVLRDIGSAKRAAFMRSLVGEPVEAITLHTGGRGFTEALTDNYLKVKVAGQLEANQWVCLRVEGVEGEMLIGGLVSGPKGAESSWKSGANMSSSVVTQECTDGNKRIDLQPFAPLG